MTHDASTGFHDIKPLPEFHPFPFLFISTIVAVILIATLLFFLWKRRSKKVSLPPPPPPAPEKVALDELRRLEQLREHHEIELRVLASNLSLTLRKYLEAALLFQASDQTLSEVMENLPLQFKRHLPRVDNDTKSTIGAKVERLLRYFASLTFGAHTEAACSLEDQDLIQAIATTKELVTTIAQCLRKEAEWRQSVIQQSVIQQGITEQSIRQQKKSVSPKEKNEERKGEEKGNAF